jgi:long-chain acyl-CoA synthetase
MKNIIEKFTNPTTYIIAFGAVAGKNTENILGAMGLNLLVHYGMTEASVISYSSKEHKKAYSVGKINPDMDVIISDVETGKKLGFSQKGIIKVKGKQVMKGYYNNEEETKKAFDSEG